MKKLFLTIDDAPSGRFSDVLGMLESRGIGAVIFVEGRFARERVDFLVRAVKDGFVIGNHSYSHPHFNAISPADSREEIARTDAIINNIYSAAGKKRTFKCFRFPYGEGGEGDAGRANQQVLAEFGYCAPRFAPARDWRWNVPLLEDWHVDDENIKSKKTLAAKRLLAAQTDSVIVLHDNITHGAEENASLCLFEWILEEAKGMGFSFYSNAEIAADFRRPPTTALS